MLNFGEKIVNANDKRFSKTHHQIGSRMFKIVSFNFSNYWITQDVASTNQLKTLLSNIRSKYKDLSSTDVFNNSKCYSYKMFIKF